MILKFLHKIDNKFKKFINFGLLKKSFFLLSLVYFSIYFTKNFGQISFNINFEKNGINFFISFLFCIMSIYFNAFAWKNIVRWFGKIDVKNKLVSFYVLTNILKYVPGGIWHFIERFNFLKNCSNPQLAFYSTLIEPYFMLSASFLLASIGMIFSPIYSLFLIPMVFINRKLIYILLRKLESLKRKAIEALKLENSKYELERRIKLNSFFPTKAFLLEIGFILSKFGGFFMCFNMINSTDNTDLLFLLAIFCLSWSIGLVVPTAPSGVGVFEACFLFLIGRNIPQNVIIVSLIYFRLISTSADLLLSFPFLFKKVFKRI